MNKLKLACLASLFATGLANAATPCDGFEVKIQNKLADDLLVTRILLNGAAIQPDGIQKIDGQSAQVFTVSNSSADLPMNGEFTFHTISLPSKEVKINFTLNNTGLICEHSDITVEGNDYAVEKTRLPGKVNYSISNK